MVGGTAAVADAKLSGRDVTRLGGVDRWHTACLVGAAVEQLNAGVDVDVDALRERTAGSASCRGGTTVFVDGQQVRLPPGIHGDCAGEVPIVVASDAAAQSDLYAAVTLAGVLDTTCVVLAGPRDQPMNPQQRDRLDDAAEGGWIIGSDGLIVGGTAAVPDAKVDDYDLTRVGGNDRWDTAEQIGKVTDIVTDPDIDGPDLQETIAQTTGTDARYTAIAAGGWHSCAIRADDSSAACWGRNGDGRADPPAGAYTHIAAGDGHSCAIRTDGTIACWFAPNWRAAPPGVELIYGPNVKLAN